jgi:hypothetical protein
MSSRGHLTLKRAIGLDTSMCLVSAMTGQAPLTVVCVFAVEPSVTLCRIACACLRDFYGRFSSSLRSAATRVVCAPDLHISVSKQFVLRQHQISRFIEVLGKEILELRMYGGTSMLRMATI